MSSFVDLSGLDRLVLRVQRIANLNPEPLMQTWMLKTLPDDNRNGILQRRTDGDGNPLLPVTYRPATSTPINIRSKPAKPLRNNARSNTRVGAFAGFGSHAAGVNNNLTSRQYELLDGPPTAPRGAFSRVITNYRTGYEVSADRKVWTAYGYWDEVVDAKGRPFLHYLFIRRNLAGLRPEGRAEARRTFINWASDQIRNQPSGSYAA